MSKHIPQNELDAVLSAVGQFSEGASIKDVSAVWDNLCSRYIKKITVGFGGTTAIKVESHAEFEIYIPVSREGEQIKQTVREPVQNRQPVGYNRGFIDDYIPNTNTTCYLSLEIRQRLYEMGQLSDDRRPAGTYARKIFNRILIDITHIV